MYEIVGPHHKMSKLPELSSGQVAELKTVFAMLNQSGTHKLSLQELSIALEKITGETPRMEEVQRVLRKLDQNNDGQVDFNEFVSVLTQFMTDDSNTISLSDDFDKKQLHSKVADFFGSFKSDNWNQL